MAPKTKKAAPQKRSKSDAMQTFDQRTIQEFKEAFQIMDQNKDGTICKGDLKDLYASMGQIPADSVLDEMIKEAPGPINFTTFLTLFGDRLTGTDPEDVIVGAFRMFDPKDEGTISEDELKRILQSFKGEPLNEEEMKAMYKGNPPISGGKVDYKAFAKLITTGAQEDARDIVAKNGYCGFSSHGLSIGSLGRNGANHSVANVLFDKWTMEGAVYAARFKSWTGGNGFAENVTWSNIRAINVSTAAFVTQNYYDQDKGPRPDNQNKTSTRITNLTFKNFEGYLGPNWTDGTCISTPCWNYVEGGDSTQSIILDLYNGTATGLKFRNFKIHPYKQGYDKTTVICDPDTLHPEDIKVLGFKCVRGPYKTA